MAALSRGSWELFFSDKSSLSVELRSAIQQYAPKLGPDATADIDRFVALKPLTDERRGLIREHALFVSHQRELTRLVGVSLRPLLYPFGADTPVHFAMHEGSLALLIYNTALLDDRERARREIQKTILPEIRQFNLVQSPDIKSFGIAVIFGSNDPSKVAHYGLKAETVALVAHADQSRKFMNAELTEEEFVDTSDIYLMDRDSADTLRKVKISLH